MMVLTVFMPVLVTGYAGSDGAIGRWKLEAKVWEGERGWLFAVAGAVGAAWDSDPNPDETIDSLVCALRICKRVIPCAWISFDSELSCLPVFLAGMPPLQHDVLLCQEVPYLVYQPPQFHTGWPVFDWPPAAQLWGGHHGEKHWDRDCPWASRRWHAWCRSGQKRARSWCRAAVEAC